MSNPNYGAARNPADPYPTTPEFGPDGAPVPAYAPPTHPQPSYPQPTYAQPEYAEPTYTQPTYTQPAHPQPTYAQPAESTSPEPSAKERAADVADTGKQAAGDVAQTATGAAKDVAHETRKQASDLLGKTKGQFSEQAGAQKQSLVENLRSIHEQLAAMTERADTDGAAVDAVARTRDRAKDAADWLDHREPNEIVDELRRIGRDKPGRFLAGALLAGIAAGRLTRGTVAVHTDQGSDGRPDSTSGGTGTQQGPSTGAFAEPAPRHAVAAPSPNGGLPLMGDQPGGYEQGGFPTGGVARP